MKSVPKLWAVLVTSIVFGAAVIVIDAGPASARAIVGTGQVDCSSASGSLTFHPAWRTSGVGTVHAKADIVLSGCTGGTPTPSTVTTKFSFTMVNGGTCSAIGYGVVGMPSPKLKYSPTVKASRMLGAGLDFNTSGEPPGYWLFTAGTALVNGSYPSPDAQISVLAYSAGSCSAGITSLSLTPPSGLAGQNL